MKKRGSIVFKIALICLMSNFLFLSSCDSNIEEGDYAVLIDKDYNYDPSLGIERIVEKGSFSTLLGYQHNHSFNKCNGNVIRIYVENLNEKLDIGILINQTSVGIIPVGERGYVDYDYGGGDKEYYIQIVRRSAEIDEEEVSANFLIGQYARDQEKEDENK